MKYFQIAKNVRQNYHEITMNNLQRGQMTWKSEGTINRVLYLRGTPHEPWRHYQEFPQYAKPDSGEKNPGYATFLCLLRAGWKLIN